MLATYIHTYPQEESIDKDRCGHLAMCFNFQSRISTRLGCVYSIVLAIQGTGNEMCVAPTVHTTQDQTEMSGIYFIEAFHGGRQTKTVVFTFPEPANEPGPKPPAKTDFEVS